MNEEFKSKVRRAPQTTEFTLRSAACLFALWLKPQTQHFYNWAPSWPWNVHWHTHKARGQVSPWRGGGGGALSGPPVNISTMADSSLRVRFSSARVFKAKKSPFPLVADLTLTQNVCGNIHRETVDHLWEYRVSYLPGQWCMNTGWI